MKRLFSSFLGKKAEDVPSPASKTGGETTTFLTGDDRIDARNVKLLLETMAELISDTDHRGLVRKIVDRAIRAVRAERGILFLEGEEGQLAVAVARNDGEQDLDDHFRYSTTVVKQVHESGKGTCLKIGDSERSEDLSASVVDLKLRAVMCTRLRFQDKVLGVIYVDSRVTSREFTTKDLRFFDALAVALSISLENARLIREALERQRLQNALEIAQEILDNLLPDDPSDLAGLDMAGRSIPAETAAGDYYDFVKGRDGRIGVVVGDVTGHGVGPAMVMTGARSALRTLFEEDLSEAEVLARLNRRLAEDLADDMFMSMIVLRLDPEKRTLTWANAGQSSPLVLKASGEVVTLSGTGLALGIDEDMQYRNQEPITLESGDMLAVFTDGIVEAGDPSGQLFGEEGLANVMREHREQPAEKIVQAVYDAAREFMKTDLDDDFTLVILKVS